MSKVKTCKTCIHQIGSGEFARCSRFGYYCTVSRSESLCGKNYEGWNEKPDSLFVQIIKKIFKL